MYTTYNVYTVYRTPCIVRCMWYSVRREVYAVRRELYFVYRNSVVHCTMYDKCRRHCLQHYKKRTAIEYLVSVCTLIDIIYILFIITSFIIYKYIVCDYPYTVEYIYTHKTYLH